MTAKTTIPSMSPSAIALMIEVGERWAMISPNVCGLAGGSPAVKPLSQRVLRVGRFLGGDIALLRGLRGRVRIILLDDQFICLFCCIDRFLGQNSCSIGPIRLIEILFLLNAPGERDTLTGPRNVYRRQPDKERNCRNDLEVDERFCTDPSDLFDVARFLQCRRPASQRSTGQ